ncbi:MAG: hypothetical protein ACLQGP_14380, partial [Isosphaeraceae bacterium]
PLGWATAALGIATAGLTLRAGGRPFRLILAVAFGYLALQAIRNANLFGLVAGFVLAADLGEWAGQLAAVFPASPTRRAMNLGARAVLAGLLGLLIVATVSGRFFRATGERRGFGTFASPLAYAHEAARFAGRPGLPDHALAISLRQAAVYIFHNGPERKVFMDGRLEVPTRETFESYMLLGRMLNEGRPGWDTALRRMGDPLVLLDHEANIGAEATLLVDPAWRCVYSDAVGSVFLSRRLRGLDASYPDVDFVARHFADAAWQSVPSRPLGLAEGRSLIGLATTVKHRPGSDRSLRLALALLACDRFRQAIADDPTAAEPWSLLGDACSNLSPDSVAAPPGPDERWDPARGLLPSQAAFCYRQALERDPGEIRALFALFRSFDGRRMDDARRSVAAMMRRAWTEAVGVYADHDASLDLDPDRDPSGRPLEAAAEPLPPTDWSRLDADGLARSLVDRLRQGRPEAAALLLAEADGRGIVPGWSASDRVAAGLLLMGRPAEARRIWEHATDPPSPAMRWNRIATAALASMDFPAADGAYRAALGLDPGLGEAWFGLAFVNAQRGTATEALAACREGLRRPLSPAQGMFLRSLEALIGRIEPAG